MDLPIPYKDLDTLDQERLIGSMYDLMSAFVEVYGPDSGQELWDSFSKEFGRELRNGLLMAMLTGQMVHGGSVRIRGPHNRNQYNKVAAIKAIRTHGKLGLRESKDIIEQADNDGVVCSVKIVEGRRNELISKLKDCGVHAY